MLSRLRNRRPKRWEPLPYTSWMLDADFDDDYEAAYEISQQAARRGYLEVGDTYTPPGPADPPIATANYYHPQRISVRGTDMDAEQSIDKTTPEWAERNKPHWRKPMHPSLWIDVPVTLLPKLMSPSDSLFAHVLKSHGFTDAEIEIALQRHNP